MTVHQPRSLESIQARATSQLKNQREIFPNVAVASWEIAEIPQRAVTQACSVDVAAAAAFVHLHH